MKYFRWNHDGMVEHPCGEFTDAGQVEKEMAEAKARIAELESAIDKLAECKGRYHTEANFKALMAVRNK